MKAMMSISTFGGSSKISLEWNELGVLLSRSTWEQFPHVFLVFVCFVLFDM